MAARSSRSWSGIVQWCPARTAIPNRSSTCATSCGWMPGRLNGTTPPRWSAGGPYSSMPGISRVEHLERVGDELALVLADVVHADLEQVVGGRAQPHAGRDVRRAGLELPGHVVPLRPAEVDLADHVAAAHERRHRLEELGLRPHRTPEPSRGEHLVPAEHVEVAADRRHVDRDVRHGLRPVDEDERAGLVRLAGHLLDRVDRAQRVRHVGERDQLRLELEQDVEHVLAQDPVVGDRDELEVRVLLLGEDLPRDEVRVVLHLGQDDHVAARDVLPAPRVGDEVDRLGRVAHEHDLVRVLGADERRDLDPRALPGRGRLLGQLVDAAMDVRVVAAVVLVDRVDHDARLLRRRGRVEVHEAMPVDLLVEDREVAA